MKKNTYTVILLFTVCLILLSLVSCTSLKDAKLKENPDFEKNAVKYVITSPLSHRSSIFNHFILEDPGSGAVYEIHPNVGSPLEDVNLLGRKKTAKKDVIHTKEVSTHYFSVVNPLDSNGYDVMGEVTFYRSSEKKPGSSFQSGEKEYPIKFTISEPEGEVGILTINKPGFSKVTVDVMIHGQDLKLEYQSIANKDEFVFEDDSGLVALIGLKPKGVISTRKIGDLLIKRTLSPENQSDVLTAYIIAETVFSILDETGI